MIYKYRDKFSGITEAIGKAFGKLPVSPNAWTFLSIIAALGSFYFILKADFIPASALFAAAAFLDVIDGAVAKEQKSASSIGAYFDTVADRYTEFLIIFGLFLSPFAPSALFAPFSDFMIPSKTWLFIALFGSILTSYSISAAHEEGIDEKKLRGGILERAERLMMLFAIIAILGFFPAYAYLAAYLIAALAILSNITALQRISIAVRAFKERA